MRIHKSHSIYLICESHSLFLSIPIIYLNLSINLSIYLSVYYLSIYYFKVVLILTLKVILTLYLQY